MWSPDGRYGLRRGELSELRMGSPKFGPVEVLGSPCSTDGRRFGRAGAFSEDSRHLAIEELVSHDPPATRVIVFDLASGSELVVHDQAPGFIPSLQWIAPGRLAISAWSHLAGTSGHICSMPDSFASPQPEQS
jgi:hypothetical protein